VFVELRGCVVIEHRGVEGAVDDALERSEEILAASRSS